MHAVATGKPQRHQLRGGNLVSALDVQYILLNRHVENYVDCLWLLYTCFYYGLLVTQRSYTVQSDKTQVI